jgi:hypothetical protein
MAEHILGPTLASDPRAAVAELNKKDGAALGVSMRSTFYVTTESATLIMDRKASLVAADARKLVDAFAKVLHAQGPAPAGRRASRAGAEDLQQDRYARPRATPAAGGQRGRVSPAAGCVKSMQPRSGRAAAAS